jgi:predicted anti-sigma-YlaC factor YlaD
MGDDLEGRLAPEQRPGFEEHLAECPPCRNYLTQIRVTLKALENLPRPAVSGSKKSDLIAAFRKARTGNE